MYTLDEVTEENTDLLEALRAHFGDEVEVGMDDTGGGCIVLSIELLDGWYVWITPAAEHTSGHFPCKRPHGFSAVLYQKDDCGQAGVTLYDSTDPDLGAMLDRIGPVLARFAPPAPPTGLLWFAVSNCPTCDATVSGMKELCDVTTPLVQNGDRFVYDLDLRDYDDIYAVTNERKEVKVVCPNGHHWFTATRP